MRLRHILPLVAAFTFAACGNLLAPAAATVNEKKITIHEVEKALEEYEDSDEFQQAAQQGDPAVLRRAFEQEDLSRRIFRAVLEPEAEERGIEVNEEDVEQGLDEVRSDFATPSAFEEALKEQRLTLDRLRELIYDQQLEDQLKNEITADLTPSDAELQEFYEDNAQRYLETDASHIVLAQRGDAARVVQTLRKLDPGALAERFAQIAREESIYNATAVAGGELGYVGSGETDPAFEQAASRLSAGEISQPVRTELGWEVIWVRDRRPVPFEDVRADIIQSLAGEDRDRVWKEWLTEAYEAADIEVNPRYGELDPESLTVVNPQTSELPGTEELAPTLTPTPPAG